ncbi:hypothetical protein [Comamonas sp. JC664]|uniref:hypothetical protein n=1 Tax=Comamonas sp. JC664 TaxID=2801917 RepID=UPI00361F374A
MERAAAAPGTAASWAPAAWSGACPALWAMRCRWCAVKQVQARPGRTPADMRGAVERLREQNQHALADTIEQHCQLQQP